MIENNGIYYLYIHYRKDTNSPFYIGIGTKRKDRPNKNLNSEYTRAYSAYKRNPFWTRIVNKVGYNVSILLETNDYEFIKQKEIEFVKLYGRVNNKTGILCNLTDGGEGTKGTIHSKEYKEHQSKIRKGIKRDPLLVECTAKARRKKIYQYSLDGKFMKEWDSCREAAKSLGVGEDNISSCARQKSKSAFNYLWFYEPREHIKII